jgi:hypothetical protein
MSRARMLAPALAFGVIAAFASCATKDEVAPSQPDAAALPSVDAAAEDVADASASIAPCDSVAWCTVTTPMSIRFAFTSVWGTSKSDVWAVGSGGTILHYDGAAWNATPSGYPDTFFDVWGSGPSDVWAVASAGVMLHSTGVAADGGADWTNVPLATNANSSVYEGARAYAVWGSGPDDVRVGTEAVNVNVRSTDDLLFVYTGDVTQFLKSAADGGSAVWRVMPSKGASVRSIWGSSPVDVWMTVENTADVAHEGGVTLHGTPYTGQRPNPAAVSTGTCNECYPGCVGCGAVDDPLVWTPVDSQSQVMLESVWGSSASDVWAVGRRGTIRHITQGDARWQIVDSPTDVDLHRVWGSGPNDVWMVGDSGTVLHFDGTTITASTTQLPAESRPNLRGVWGSGPDDVWIVGDGVALHHTGQKDAQ